MRILVTGANGFIAREIIARLSLSSYEIIACVHHKILESVPHSRYFKVDFTKTITSDHWEKYLKDVDVVINCVGIFQALREKNMWNVHYEGPKALFNACEKLKLKKIIHISALGIDKVSTPYAASKLALDAYIQTLNIASTIIRPALVYGKGSYGGTSLFRGLAGLPFILPLPGRAEKIQQPIHVDDLTQIIEKALTLPGSQLIHAVGAEKLSIKNILIKLRSWLGFKKAFVISIPRSIIQIGAKIGNWIPNSPMSETGIKMMSIDLVATDQEEKNLHQLMDIKPRGFTEGLKSMVSSVQDRWHARLYFLRPMLRLSIAFIWLFSGVISMLPISLPTNYALMTQSKIPQDYQSYIIYLFSGLDILLGILTLCNFRLVIVGALQIFFIFFYTLFISYFLPYYWLHPFAPIAKNIPLLIATFIMMAIESER